MPYHKLTHDLLVMRGSAALARDHANALREEFERAAIERLCPFKVGDIILASGNRFVIDKIHVWTVFANDSDVSFEYDCRKIRKDGTPAATSQRVRVWYHEPIKLIMRPDPHSAETAVSHA